MSIADYCNKFQHKLSRLKSTGTILADSVIAYKLLKSANLSNPQELLVKATTDMTYEATTKQLKKVFYKTAITNILKSQDVTETQQVNEHCKWQYPNKVSKQNYRYSAVQYGNITRCAECLSINHLVCDWKLK